MTSNDSWYRQGDEPEPAPVSDRGERKRFWLREDEKTVVTFIDDDPFRIWEHDAKVAGRWGNRYTCINGFDPSYGHCPGCPPRRHKSWSKKYRVGYLTVVSEREFEYQGKKIKNIRRLFPMKKGLLEKFNGHKEEKGGSLVGARFRLWRTGSLSYSVGDDWEFRGFIEGITPETPDEEARKIISRHYDAQDRDGVPIVFEPYDYLEMLAPQKRAQIQQMLGISDSHPRQGGGSTTTTDTAMPVVGQQINWQHE